MKKIKELFKSLEERERKMLIMDLILMENYSITEIVAMKEEAYKSKLLRDNVLLSGLAFRASFLVDNIDMKKDVNGIVDAVKADMVLSGAFRGTKYEKKLIKSAKPNCMLMNSELLAEEINNAFKK